MCFDKVHAYVLKESSSTRKCPLVYFKTFSQPALCMPKVKDGKLFNFNQISSRTNLH